jgi:hypothetical protein
MKTYKCTPVKDEKGLIDVDITEIYNIEDPEERYPTARRQWRIGELIREEEILFDDNKVAYNGKLHYL